MSTKRRSLRKARLSCGLSRTYVSGVGSGAGKARILRQSRLLSNIWTGLGASAGYYAEPNKHHFNIRWSAGSDPSADNGAGYLPIAVTSIRFADLAMFIHCMEQRWDKA